VQKLQERLENQTRNSGQLEDRCVALKTTVDQLKERCQTAAITETELRGEINALQREKTDSGYSAALGQDKMKQLQKSLTASENERRILAERMEAAQHSMNELRRDQQSNHDQNQRMLEQIAELEVSKSSLESQLRIAKWNQENSTTDAGTESPDESTRPHLISFQRERTELRNKIDQLSEKVRQLENERRISKFSGHVQFDRSEKSLFGDGGDDVDSNRKQEAMGKYSCGMDHSKLESESRELRMKLRRLETQLAEKEAELARMKAKFVESAKCGAGSDPDRYRGAQLQAERLLDARESSHRQQVMRLENQVRKGFIWVIPWKFDNDRNQRSEFGKISIFS
jgi:rootletin